MFHRGDTVGDLHPNGGVSTQRAARDTGQFGGAIALVGQTQPVGQSLCLDGQATVAVRVGCGQGVAVVGAGYHLTDRLAFNDRQVIDRG